MIHGATLRRALQPLLAGTPLVYVDIGARKGRLPTSFRWLRCAHYVGIEADAAECARLVASAKAAHTYIPAVLGRRREPRTFHVTSDAACSSLFEPNHAFLAAFGELGDKFHVERQIHVETVTLDESLQTQGIEAVDFLKLDTQGSELDILRGADHVLRTHVLGVQTEVEFAPMYVGQPLFADIDMFLRDHGFLLFDLSRYRVRRPTLAREVPTRGQLLWGHALYLRAPDTLDENTQARLAVVAAILELPDLAAGILAALERSASTGNLQRVAAHARRLLEPAPSPGVLTQLRQRLLGGPRHLSCERDLWRD